MATATLFHAETADEVLLCCTLSQMLLWWRLQEQELEALLLMREHALSLEQLQVALKRAKRCVEVDWLLVRQGEWVRSELVRRSGRNINFHFVSEGTSQLQIFFRLSLLTLQLEQCAQDFSVDEQACADERGRTRLLEQLRDLLSRHREHFRTIQGQFNELFCALYEQRASRSARFDEIVRGAIPAGSRGEEAASPRSMEGGSVRGIDELAIATANQAVEAWFPAVLGAIRETVDLLRVRPPRLLEAEGMIRRLSTLFRLFADIILMVETTMTTADGIMVRGELEAGIGAERVQFRAIEVSMRGSDAQLHRDLEQMLAPDVPSLSAAVMDVLAEQLIILPGDPPAAVAEKLSGILLPTGKPNHHADLMALVEALVEFEQQVDAWRAAHTGMVSYLVGGSEPWRTGSEAVYLLSAGQQEAGGGQPESPAAALPPKRMFAALWAGRAYRQGHRH